jgi:hypothetical protein
MDAPRLVLKSACRLPEEKESAKRQLKKGTG